MLGTLVTDLMLEVSRLLRQELDDTIGLFRTRAMMDLVEPCDESYSTQYTDYTRRTIRRIKRFLRSTVVYLRTYSPYRR